MDRITDACENITFPYTSYAVSNNNQAPYNENLDLCKEDLFTKQMAINDEKDKFTNLSCIYLIYYIEDLMKMIMMSNSGSNTKDIL